MNNRIEHGDQIAAMTEDDHCRLCGGAPADHEIVIRSIQRRNVPLTDLKICRACALRMSTNVENRRR